MEIAFDHMAKTYDREFTESGVGRAQRSQTNKYLDKLIEGKENLNILEINCGTGEDAAYLAARGHKVLATDISGEMVRLCKEKYASAFKENLEFKQLDIRDLESITNTYDLIFSNFGGLNCLNKEELQKAMVMASGKLNKKGKMVVVLISDFCLLESLYFILSLRFNNIFRRGRKMEMAQLADIQFPVFYYSHKQLDKMLGVKSKRRIGIGCLVPPSYLDKYFPSFVIKFLNGIDKSLQVFNWPSRISDHILLEYQLKP